MNKKSKLILWATIGLVCIILITPVYAETITFGVYTSDKPRVYDIAEQTFKEYELIKPLYKEVIT